MQFILSWQLLRSPPSRSRFGIVCVSGHLSFYPWRPFLPPHHHLIMLIPAKSASACNTWEPRPSFFTFEKLRWDKNYFFPNTKKRRFFQIEKQITICCKLTGFSICLCWQGPCQPVCKAISQKIFCPSPLVPPTPHLFVDPLDMRNGVAVVAH